MSRTGLGVGAVFLFSVACSGPRAVAATAVPPDSPARLTDSFASPDGLIASPDHSPADSRWLVTSGSMFRRDDAGWTGPPDDGRLAGSNGSAVFRMVSKDQTFTDATVTMRLQVEAMTTTDRTPARDYDGAHIWVRYHSEHELYAVSVDRRDGVMVIKKKCPGGPSNGGSYYDLGPEVHGVPIPWGSWQDIQVTVSNLPDGSVSISAVRDSQTITAVDSGIGCAPLRAAGGVGLRGDNAELLFDDVRVAVP